MKIPITILLWSIIAGCNNSPQTISPEREMTAKVPNSSTNQDFSSDLLSRYGFDHTYSLSTTHHPYMVTGYFNGDQDLDTAVIVRHQPKGNDELLIVHGNTSQSYRITNGTVLGADFGDFNWADEFKVVKKGTIIYNNVIDGEIVTDDQITEDMKITLPFDGILLHVSESCGGGVLFFKDGKYNWVHQE